MSCGPDVYDNARLWLRALSRHDGPVWVATHLTFFAGKRPGHRRWSRCM